MNSKSSNFYKKGMIGLENLGNTCFLNSCIQVLKHIYEINIFLNSDKCSKLIKNNDDSILLKEWNDLFNLMWSDNGLIRPSKFVSSIQTVAKIKKKDLFTTNRQNDMPEFLMFFIECLHNSISRPVDMLISGKIENKTDSIAKECYSMLKKCYKSEFSEIMNPDINLMRFQIIKFAFYQIYDYLFFGYGTGSFEVLFQLKYPDLSNSYANHAHSDIIEFIGEVGIIGLFLFSIPIFKFFTKPVNFNFSNSLLIFFVIIILLFDFSLHIPIIQLLFISFFVLNKKFKKLS